MAKTLEKLQLELRDTLESLGRSPGQDKMIEVVAVGSRHDDIRLMFRVHDEGKWLKILGGYLAGEKDATWYSFIGKKYLLKEGRTVYAWNIVLESESLDATVQQVRKLFLAADESVTGTKQATVEVDLPTDSGYRERQQARVKPTRG